MKSNSTFVEVGFVQKSKFGQSVFGDVFVSNRLPEDDRIVCVLADGLGSGIKANVLATLTSTMAMKYVSSDIDIQRASEIIMSTLPICSKRKIGYSTFTIVDVRNDGTVKIIEYENPPYVLMRKGNVEKIEKKRLVIDAGTAGNRELYYSCFAAREDDMLVFFSDGVTQSGIGSGSMPLGWGVGSVEEFVGRKYRAERNISARSLAQVVVRTAFENDREKAKDDITVAVVNFRRPRKLMVVTGPPYNERNDAIMANTVDEYDGMKAICGGTTASIVARELGRNVEVDLSDAGTDVPPASKMQGVDLVTEGTLTLSRVMEILRDRDDFELLKDNAAVRLVKLFIESDIIEFVVGTRVNEAHQDPNLPAELDIRRNLIKKIVSQLNEKYLKEAKFKLI